ncbi:MAG: DoxX family protein [Bacteroidia bacterium]|nr:DoxX family protein [Bacteroidia bacterium]
MKKYRIIYWISTVIIFLFEGVMPALTFQTDMAKEGISHLGFPEYFGVQLAICKVLGALALIIPGIPPRYKEWAYTGFGISMISAFVAHVAVDGFSAMSCFPLLAILVTSYICFHKLLKAKNSAVPA